MPSLATFIPTLWAISALSYPATAQIPTPPTALQLNTFNSSISLTPSQISRGSFSAEQAQSAANVINYERSQLAGGLVSEDDFYTISPELASSSYAPGSPIKVEEATNITTYAIGPNLALSRIVYTTLTLNSTLVPASAFVLWPFSPKAFPSVPSSAAPAVIWTHPTSGYFGDGAPSKSRVLSVGDAAPFALAQAGYVVIAPDYAGLGVSKGFDGEDIRHQYLASPAGANDAIYAFKAARAVWKNQISEKFVSMGHSQGGGVTWAVAELMAQKPELSEGYLGAIPISPTTVFATGAADFITPTVGQGLDSVFPEFKLNRWLSAFGIRRLELFKELQGSVAAQLVFFTGEEAIAKAGWNETWEVQAYSKLANAGRKEVKGPVLVIQGTEDIYVTYPVTSETVAATCREFPQNELQYLVSNGTGHVPALFSTRQVWLQWIEDRFNGKPVERKKCGETRVLDSFLPIERYQRTWNSYTQWAGAPEYTYQTPFGP